MNQISLYLIRCPPKKADVYFFEKLLNRITDGQNFINRKQQHIFVCLCCHWVLFDSNELISHSTQLIAAVKQFFSKLHISGLPNFYRSSLIKRSKLNRIDRWWQNMNIWKHFFYISHMYNIQHNLIKSE